MCRGCAILKNFLHLLLSAGGCLPAARARGSPPASAPSTRQRATRRQMTMNSMPNDENHRTIATRVRHAAPLAGDLDVEHLQELFWRWFGSFGFFRGFSFLDSMFGATPQEKAYLAPFVAFLGVMAARRSRRACSAMATPPGCAREPRYWVYPAADARLRRAARRATGGTTNCSCAPRHSRGHRHRRRSLCSSGSPRSSGSAFPPRLDGFNPAFFGADGWPYWLNVTLRFLRLVIIVPLLEEIFWRGFLLRYLINEEFTKVPLGGFSWFSFGIVTAGFCLEHSPRRLAGRDSHRRALQSRRLPHPQPERLRPDPRRDQSPARRLRHAHRPMGLLVESQNCRPTRQRDLLKLMAPCTAPLLKNSS